MPSKVKKTRYCFKIEMYLQNAGKNYNKTTTEMCFDDHCKILSRDSMLTPKMKLLKDFKIVLYRKPIQVIE